MLHKNNLTLERKAYEYIMVTMNGDIDIGKLTD